MATVTSTCGIVTVPLVRGTARTIDLAVGERIEAPIFQVGAERRMDHHGSAYRPPHRPPSRNR
jgi:hypothetical protein